MKTQLQAVSLRIQALRSNQQMGEAMKGATRAMGMMNRSMNLPQVQKIMREFERESEVMDMKEEMMSDAVDQAMDDEEEGVGEEEESDAILKEVLDGIGVDLSQNVSCKGQKNLIRPNTHPSIHSFFLQLTEAPTASLTSPNANANAQQRVAIGEDALGGGGSSGNNGGSGQPAASSHNRGPSSGGGGGGGADEDALQARLDQLRRG